MRRRDGAPLWIEDGKQLGDVLQRADLAKSQYDEAWLQSLLYCHPEIFPIEQIEPGFGKLIPLCRELPVFFGGGRSGALDNLLATQDGGLVLVEAKLWRNPEARRSAVAQALEYAAAVFRMSYSELESAVLKARGAARLERSLFEIAAAGSSGIDSEEFVDAVSRNLARGRAVIAVVGDGIREDIIPIANLVQSHAGHRFTFALVELAVYETPATGVRLLVPSVLAQTTLIERGVVRIEGDGHNGLRVTVEPASSTLIEAPPAKGISLGEDEFFEQLARRDPRFPELLKSFLVRAGAIGVYTDLQGGLNLKHTSPTGRPLNMGYVEKSGIIATDPSTWGDRRSLGLSYNATLAKLTGGSVIEAKNGDAGLRTAAGKMPRLSDLLPQHEQAWLDAMEQYIRECPAASPTE